MPNRDYYLQLDNENFANARDELVPCISSMLQQAGIAAAEATTAADAVYALEASIAAAQWDSVTNRDPEKIYNPYSQAKLAELGASHNWPAVLETIGVAGEKQIIIEQPSCFAALNKLIAETPLDTWQHYLRFRILDSTGMHLDEATAAIRFDYRNRVLRGQKQERPRWKRGIDMVDELVGEAVGKLYVAEYFPPAAKAKMEELVQNVTDTLEESLGELQWMSPETQAKAKDKLRKFTPKIGYPDEWKDYSSLEIVAGFTGPQRFFIGHAMSRKGKFQDAATISRLASDPHSPLKYRVNGPYRNIDAFHAAFGTREGDGMWLPPEDRVRIW